MKKDYLAQYDKHINLKYKRLPSKEEIEEGLKNLKARQKRFKEGKANRPVVDV